MGRQQFLTRLALGRSALGPVETQSPQDRLQKKYDEIDIELESSSKDGLYQTITNDPISSGNHSIIAQSFNYHQQYDTKGYPRNLSSGVAKKTLRHAVNDILATVGVCIFEDRGPKETLEVQDPRSIDEVQIINTYGDVVSKVDELLKAASEGWVLPLEARLQTFKFYADIPLVEIVKSEWKRFGKLQFLYAGLPSSLLFLMLNGGIEAGTRTMFQAIKATVGRRGKLSTGWQKLENLALDIAESLVNFSLFMLIAPLDLYRTLQQLDLLPPLSPMPSFRNYMSFFPAAFSSKRRFGFLIPLVFTSLVYLRHRQDGIIHSKLEQYIWAALPKPTRPDRISLIAAHKGEFDDSDIAGLTDEDDSEEQFAHSPITNQLAHDLRALGGAWQRFYNTCANLVRPEDSSKPSDPRSSRVTERLVQSRRSSACLETREADQVQASLGDRPDRSRQSSSPPTSSPHIPEQLRPNQSSTTALEPLEAPNPFELTRRNENGYTYVAISMPQSPHTSNDETLESPETPGTPERREIPRRLDQEGPTPLSDEDTAIAALRDENSGPQQTQSRLELYHRLTVLSAHPAQSMAERLTAAALQILHLPFKAFYLRYLAIAFLSSPTQSAFSTEAAARWKREIYQPWSCLSPGWNAGGLRSTGKYVGKLFLVLGLQLGVSYATWQIGMGAVWWIGKTYKAWTKPETKKDTMQ